MKIPLVFALVGVLGVASWAQPDDAPPPALVQQQQKERTFQVPLKNIKPSLMAWWLDPTHHEVPMAIGATGAPPRPSSDFKEGLPTGVSRVVAVDPQNALLVFATPDGAAQIANIIRFLDRPLRQVEIEARFFQIDSESIEKLGFHPLPTVTGAKASRVTGGLEATLLALQNQKKAVLITAPRVTAINNMMAPLQYKTERPTKILVSGKDISDAVPLMLANNYSLRVTPTINNDDTVTLLVEGEQRVDLQGVNATGAITLDQRKEGQFIINLRDGESVAIEEQLQGPDTLLRSTSKNIVFLTPRIIRRVGDDNAGNTQLDIPVGMK